MGDTPISLWQKAGLRLESTARMSKFATIAKAVVVNQLGSLEVTDTDQTQQSLRSLLIRLSPAG